MFDSHCHLQNSDLDATTLIARARAIGVNRFLLAGVDPEDWRAAEALCEQHVDVYMSYGVHPQRIAEIDDKETDAMLASLKAQLEHRHARVVALGEIGLDAMGARKSSLARQERAFIAQLDLARTYNLPILFHILRAHSRALGLLKSQKNLTGVVHSYSGSVEEAARYLALGLHLSFAGPVTFNNASRVKQVVKAVPRERLLAETDAPDQTPEPYRPGKNEPAYLPAVISAIAHVRDEPPDVVATYTEENARRLFGLIARVACPL